MPSAPPIVAVDLRALVPEATGIGVYTRELVGALARRGTFRYLGVAHREPRAAGALRTEGVRIEHQPARLGVLWQQVVLPRWLATQDVDLFWSPLQTLPVVPLAPLPVPGVVTVHDLTVVLMPEAHRAKVRWSQLPFLAASLERARRVVADSEATARDLRSQFPAAFREDPEKLRVVYPGVAERFRPADDAERRRIREELGCPGGFLLFAGTLEPRKNVAGVLDAWISLRAGDPKGTPPLVVAGGYGWHSRRLAARLERVAAQSAADGGARLHLLGRVDDETLARLYRGATVFLYPSFYEGFGLPVAEAMASGAPVVTSDRSSLPEVVGDAGLTVPADDAPALAAAVRRLLDRPELAAELGDRGRARARSFSWQGAAAAMDEVFTAALG